VPAAMGPWDEKSSQRLASGHFFPCCPQFAGPHLIPTLFPGSGTPLVIRSFCILCPPSYPPVRFLCTFGFRARKVPRATGSLYIGFPGVSSVSFATLDPPLSSPRYPTYTHIHISFGLMGSPLLFMYRLCIFRSRTMWGLPSLVFPTRFLLVAETCLSCLVWRNDDLPPTQGSK